MTLAGAVKWLWRGGENFNNLGVGDMIWWDNKKEPLLQLFSLLENRPSFRCSAIGI